MRRKITNLILVVVLAAGLSLLLYPSVSNYWNSFHQSRIISSYAEQVAELSEKDYNKILDNARVYNKELQESGNRFQMTAEEWAEYNSQLDPFGSGIMGYVEIEAINCKLPIYHGTDEAVLQIGTGHLEWSSLPVGGEGTHTVISGHRGLPSAALFTDLDQLQIGDIFTLSVLDEILTYEVDQILIVLPTDAENLQIEEGKDYCTLMTCTPYGVNSHRLLVRGHRIESAQSALQVHISADAIRIEPMLVAPMMGIPVVLILLIILLIRDRKK